jgi:hypothetical protein
MKKKKIQTTLFGGVIRSSGGNLFPSYKNPKREFEKFVNGYQCLGRGNAEHAPPRGSRVMKAQTQIRSGMAKKHRKKSAKNDVLHLVLSSTTFVI